MNVRYEISDGHNPVRIVKPYIGTDASVSWEKQDAPIFDFKKELKELILLKNDFRYFYNLEKSANRCDLQNLSIILECGSDAFSIFEGHFTMSSGTWDLDRCTVKFKINFDDKYKCVDDNDDDVNILDYPNPQIVRLPVTIGIETFICISRGNGSPKCEAHVIENGLWTFYENKRITFIEFELYIRQYMITNCDYIASSDWTLYEDCSGGQKKYIRKIQLEQNKYIGFDSDSGNVNDYPVINQIDNGRRLREVMQGLLNAACSGLTLKSEFFQWNQDITTDINYVTNEFNKLTNLIIFQKSDVKRGNVSNNATKAMFNFKKAIVQICDMFNCRYRIEGTDFRIEHLSYFETDYGINLMNDKNNNLLKGTRKYSYDESQLPKYENFEFMESGSKDFVGVPIEYINNCVNNDEENRVTIKIDDITTDVMLAIENPEPDGDVSDDGFVIMACDALNNIYYEDGILEANTTINNILSWAHLQRDFWKHGRVFMNGLMNNRPTDFLSIIPTIKQEKFTAKLNCIEVKNFDPLDQIKATLGWGFIESAEFKLSKCVMSFELKLEDIQQPDSGGGDFDFGDFDGDFSEDFD